MALARQRYPDVYASCQEHTEPGNFKRAPRSYEDLVSEQIAKGFSHEVAAQRVCQLYGSRAFDYTTSFAKAANVAASFDDAAEAIHQDEGCSRTEALRKARLLNGRLFKALQAS